MRTLLFPCPISEASLMLKSLVAPAGLCSALELSRSWEQSCSRRTKAHLALTSGAAPALVRAQPRALCVEAGAVHWSALDGDSPGLLLASTLSSIQEDPHPWTGQGAGEPLNSWRLSQSRYFTSDDATIEWNNEKKVCLICVAYPPLLEIVCSSGPEPLSTFQSSLL